MSGHFIEHIKEATAPKSQDAAHPSAKLDQVAAGINELHALTRRGLWGMLLFLSLSATVLYCSEAGIFAMVPAEVRNFFGELPPPRWLHAVLAVSWLSAFVLIMGRMVDDSEPCYNWYNVGLPTIFYPLYIFTEGAATYFPAVFAAGLILLVCEHVSVTLHARRLLREETARLRQLNHLKN